MRVLRWIGVALAALVLALAAVYEPVWEAMVDQLGAPERESVWIFQLAPWPEARLHFGGGGT